MRLSLKTAPSARALDWTTEVMGHLRLDSNEEQDRVVNVLIPAAEEWAQSATGRQLITATWTLYLRGFPSTPCPIWLPKPPLRSVTSVKYYDALGAQQTLSPSDYIVTTEAGPKAGPGFIQTKPLVYWPTTYGPPYEVEIEFVAGYGAASSDVPGLLRQGMLLLVGEMFERREQSVVGAPIAQVPLSAERLILPFLSEHV